MGITNAIPKGIKRGGREEEGGWVPPVPARAERKIKRGEKMKCQLNTVLICMISEIDK